MNQNTNDVTNTSFPTSQKLLTYLYWIFLGTMALGGVIGVLNDTFEFVTLPLSIVGTIVIVFFWFAAQQYLKRYPWQTRDTPITHLRLGYQLPLVGMILLLWLPQLIKLAAPLPFQAERNGETLIVISTFAYTEGIVNVNAQGEIQRAIEDKLAELKVNTVRVEIEEAVIPSRDREAAKALGNQYDASIIIWGADTGVRLEVNFLNLKLPNFETVEVTLNETERTQLAQPDAYAQFITKDLPNQLSFLALFALGNSFAIQGEIETATGLLQAAVNIMSDVPIIPSDFDLDIAYFNLALLYGASGQFGQAIANYDETIKLNPQFEDAFNNRGITYGELEDYETAIKDFTEVIRLDPQSNGAFNNRGIAYAQLEEYETALKDFNKSIELYPQSDTFINRGNIYANLEDYEAAFADYEHAVNLSPQDPLIFYRRAHAYHDLGDYEATIADLDQAIRLEPEFKAALLYRGSAYGDLGDYQAAIANFGQAINLDPDFSFAFYLRGLVHNDIGDSRAAIADFDQAILLNPQDAVFFFSRAGVHYILGNYEAALNDYNQAILLDSQYADAFFNRAVVNESLGNYEAALTDYDQAICLDPQHADAFFQQAVSNYSKGEIALAISYFERYIKLVPDAPNRAQIENLVQQLQPKLSP